MKVVATADDFGFSADTVAATIRLLERGVVRNASIMVGAPGSAIALRYAAAHPEHCYGVHLTLTRDGPEHPIADPASIPALVDASGGFHPGRAAQWRSVLGRFPVDQVVTELDAQLQVAADHGITIDYADSHKHLHKYPAVGAALEHVLPRFGITRVRRPQNVYPVAQLTSPTFWLGRVLGRRWRRRWITTDYFYMSVGARDLDFPAAMSGLGSGTTLEIGAHPGTEDGWRIAETAAFERFSEFAAAAGHELVAWRDINAE